MTNPDQSFSHIHKLLSKTALINPVPYVDRDSSVVKEPVRNLMFYAQSTSTVRFRATRVVIKRSRVRIQAGAAGGLFSPGSTFCADSYFSIRSTPVLPQKHEKDLGHSAKSVGGSLQLNTHALYVCGFA